MGHLPFTKGIWKIDHVDLGVSRLVGLIGHPGAIGRELSPSFTESGVDQVVHLVLRVVEADECDVHGRAGPLRPANQDLPIGRPVGHKKGGLLEHGLLATRAGGGLDPKRTRSPSVRRRRSSQAGVPGGNRQPLTIR